MTALYDQDGNKLPRFGFAGIKRTLKDPIKVAEDCKKYVYAMVWCEEAEVFIFRYGADKDFDITIQYWDDADTDEPNEEVFDNLDAGIKHFMKLCKRKLPYERV